MSDLPQGIFANRRDKAPDFVLCGISIRLEQFVDWLKTQTPNEKGYLNFQVLKSKEGKVYIKLDEYKRESTPPSPQNTVIDYPVEEINPEDIPF